MARLSGDGSKICPVNTRSRVVWIAALGFLAAMLLLVGAWWHNGWDLAKTAQVGETAGPIVGILSLMAVGVALWSVHVQRDALELQRTATSQQQTAINEQLALQRQALDQQKQELLHQRESLEAEFRYRRHAALREAYGPVLTAVTAYHHAVDAYLDKARRANGEADKRIRSLWQVPCNETHAELARLLVPVANVDTSAERQEHRWRLSLPIRLEPQVDTAENQRDWPDVILYRLSQLTYHHVALRDSLHREFGDSVATTSPRVAKIEEELRADLKAMAEAIKERIGTQLKELVREEAIRSGRIEP